MDVKDIDLGGLIKKLTSGFQLSLENIEVVNKILFCNKSTEQSPKDIVIVLGNPTCLEDRIVKAVETMKECSAYWILLSGGVFIPGNTRTEALGMYDYCVSSGIENRRIILENESTTTRENVILSAPLISALNLSAPRIVTVSSATHLRRVRMNFEKFKVIFPENTTFSYVQSVHRSCEPENWFLCENSKRIVATELQLIKQYIFEFNYSSFDI